MNLMERAKTLTAQEKGAQAAANGRPRIDYTDKDYDSLREAMLDLAGEKLPEWTDHSPHFRRNS